METTRDQTRAFLYAVGVHVLAVLVMFAGLLASPPEKLEISGGALEAVLVDMSIGRPLPKPATKPTPKPAQPTPAPPKPEPPKPEPVAKPEPAPPPPPPQAVPDEVTDQRPAPPPPPDQAALNLQRQQQEELKRQQEIERQRAQQLEDIRRQRAEAAKQTQAEEQRLARAQEAQRAEQILNQPAEPEGNPLPGQGAADSLKSQYGALLIETIRQRWRRPAGTPVGIRCVMVVRQIPGGEVIAAEIGQPCNAPDLVRQSIIDAIERASPLPYDGFETVFNRSLELTFEYDGQ